MKFEKSIFLNTLFLLLFILGCFSCNKEEVVIEEEVEEGIDMALLPYVNSFYEEANKRGISLSKDINAFLVDKVGDITGVCGLAVSGNSSNVTKPTIWIISGCFETYSERAKEELVYHELGHAVLGRSHVKGVLNNGFQKSIMCSGDDQTCTGFPGLFHCLDFEEYYIDELFDKDVAPPDWAYRTWEYKEIIFSDLKDTFDDKWVYFSSDCDTSSWDARIDSTSNEASSKYSLMLDTNCGYQLLARKKIPINSFTQDYAIKLSCDISTINLEGNGLRISLWVKSKGKYISFARGFLQEEIIGSQQLDNYELIVECIETEIDTLVLDYLILENTTGTVLIDNIDISTLE